MRRVRAPVLLLSLPFLAVLLGAPARCPFGSSSDPKPNPGPAPVTRGEPDLRGELHVVAINGGDRRQVNYRSHLEHLKQLVDLIEHAEVDPARVTIFASDGEDPEADLATREVAPHPDFWLLPRSGVAEHLRPPIHYVNSRLDGYTLRPATRAALHAWFEEQSPKLGPGDTLLLYVTDHGRKNKEDLTNNTISLWGEALHVEELREILAQLDPAVRVVMLMSQCFSGSFAYASLADPQQLTPFGNVCGYFSTTPDRLAYGCYPEVSEDAQVGHSHRVFDAWRELGSLPDAHRRALVTDRTPDVPHVTSDFYLERLLEREAEASERPLAEVVDGLLREAWRDRGAWEPEIRLLDGIAHAFGLFSPRSLAELDAQAEGLPELAERLDTYADRWKDALEALKRENWNRFLAAHPEWRPRFQAQALRKLAPAERRERTEELLEDFVPFTRGDRDTHERLLALKRKADDAGDASYRAEVRLGAVLRMRAVLTSIAGRVYVERARDPSWREGIAALARCENLALFDSPETGVDFAVRDPFPPLEEDRARIESVMPSWMGIRYRPAAGEPRRELGLPRGAVKVLTVYPDSPAAAAGIEAADWILGADGRRFEEPHAVREWIMRSQLYRPASVEILRDGRPLELTLIPGPYPLELPKLPGPPKVGSAAPPLEVEPFRGGGTPSGKRILFFWATWCGPCKQSLPELLAFAEAEGAEVLAITDEEPEILDAFFQDFRSPFPKRVAIDPRRTSFQRYGVSGTPTFVLVDAEGVIRHYQRGYRPASGLEVPGWEWSRSSR